MAEDKPWKVTNVERVMRYDDAHNPVSKIAVSYTVPARNYTHTIELLEPEATPEAIQHAIQADVDRLEGIYAL